MSEDGKAQPDFFKFVYVDSPSTPNTERRSLRIQALKNSASLNNVDLEEKTPKRSTLFHKIVKSPVKRIFSRSNHRDLSRRTITEPDLNCGSNFDQNDEFLPPTSKSQPNLTAPVPTWESDFSQSFPLKLSADTLTTTANQTKISTQYEDPETDTLNSEDVETYFDSLGNEKPCQNEAAAAPSTTYRIAFKSKAAKSIADEVLKSNESLAHFDRESLNKFDSLPRSGEKPFTKTALGKRSTSFWELSAADESILNEDNGDCDAESECGSHDAECENLIDTEENSAPIVPPKKGSPNFLELISNLKFDNFPARSEVSRDKAVVENAKVFEFQAVDSASTRLSNSKPSSDFSEIGKKKQKVSFDDRQHTILAGDALKQKLWKSKIADECRIESKRLAYRNLNIPKRPSLPIPPLPTPQSQPSVKFPENFETIYHSIQSLFPNFPPIRVHVTSDEKKSDDARQTRPDTNIPNNPIDSHDPFVRLGAPATNFQSSNPFLPNMSITPKEIDAALKIVPQAEHTRSSFIRFISTADLAYASLRNRFINNPIAENQFVAQLRNKLPPTTADNLSFAQQSYIDFKRELLRSTSIIRKTFTIENQARTERQTIQETPLGFLHRLQMLMREFILSAELEFSEPERSRAIATFEAAMLRNAPRQLADNHLRRTARNLEIRSLEQLKNLFFRSHDI